MTKPQIEPCPKCGDVNYKSIYRAHSELFEIVCNECGFYQSGNSSINAIVNWNIASKEYNKNKYSDTERLNWLVNYFNNVGVKWSRDIIDYNINKEKSNDITNQLTKTRDKLNADLSEYGRRCEYDKEFWGEK